MWWRIFFGCLYIFSNFIYSMNGQSNSITSNKNKAPILEFDESDISNLNLKIKWKPNSSIIPTKFVLLLEKKSLNFTTFLFDFSAAPQLIDDEDIVKTSQMKPENLVMRVPLLHQSNFECAMNCINSTKFSKYGQKFECNIYFFDPHSRSCVLYEYNFENDKKKKRRSSYFKNDAFDYFIDDCEMDELIGDIVGYSKYCRRILDFRDNHLIKIIPFTDYRFSLSIRDSNNVWTPFIRKEYQYAPKITIDVKGDLRLGNNISLECNTELSSSVVDSITWKNNNLSMRNILHITPLTIHNMMNTYFCEIRYNLRTIQKAFKLNTSSIELTKPYIKINSTVDVENLTVKINWEVNSTVSEKFQPEKMILMYSEDNQPYRFVNKYLLFDLSIFDNIKLSFSKNFEEIITNNEDECAMACLQKSFCDHFVFIRSIEPYRSSTKKNCQLSTSTNNNLIACRYDSICATLSPYEKHVKNNSVSIFVLPNKSYKFKIQLKDKFLNWTDYQETRIINMPLNISLEQSGETFFSEKSTDEFHLICKTNIMKSIEHQIIWVKNDREIFPDEKLFISKTISNYTYANSILVFKDVKQQKNGNIYNGNYQCKLHIRYPDVGQGSFYMSERKNINFNFYAPLKYNTSFDNITLPAMPGLLLEVSCQVSGNPIQNLKWIVDGVNYNEKNFEILNDEPFVINITDHNNSLVNNILVMKMDNPKKPIKCECILNDKIIIRQNYIQFLDEKPKLDLKIDNSSLNLLKLVFKLNLSNKPDKLISQSDLTPLKFSILYSENSATSSAYQTNIAPETLSKSDIESINTLDRLPIATLKSAKYGIESCKILCFNTPFCKSYEYLMIDESCNLFSNSKVESYYKNLIEKLKNNSPNSSFNLIHLLQANILSLLQENFNSNNTIIVDKKTYPECKPKPTAFFLTEELHCSDEIAEFTDTYVLENLVPSSIYQFKVEIANPFGRSESFITEKIQIPFPLNPIKEKDEMRGNKEYYSLECSTALLDTKKLQFQWLQNHTVISNNNPDFEQVLQQPLAKYAGATYSTELIFKKASNKLNGAYTCLLIYMGDNFNITKNETFLYRTKDGPHFKVYPDTIIEKRSGENWEDACSAEGWPLPKVEWYRNNQQIISNGSNYDDDDDEIKVVIHHQHLNVSSRIKIKNLTEKNIGRYSCVVNGKIKFKNVTIKFIRKDETSNDESQIDEDSKQPLNNGKTDRRLSIILFPLAALVLASIIAAVFIFTYYKKRKSNSSTSLSYNRIEEEIVTGVDNLTLIDDTN